MTRRAKALRERYPAGTIVRLSHMEGEAHMPEGLRGEVLGVDSIGQIHCAWENGSTLALEPEKDSFTVISTPKKHRDEPCR